MSARAFVFDGITQIRVESIGAGSVLVEPAPPGAPPDTVEGTLSGGTDAELSEVVLRQDHGVLRIEVPTGLRGPHLNVRLGAPPELDYVISTGTADVAIAPQAGRVKVRSGSGDVTLGLVREVDCTSGSGDVAIDHVRGGAAKLASGSGDVVVHRATGPVQVRSGSGDVTVRELRQARLTASSGSGDIAVASTTGSVDLRSASGSLTVGVADGLPAWLDLHSVSGAVRIALVAGAEPGAGEPYVTVRARTASGEIAVYRS